MQDVREKASEALIYAIKNGISEAMNKYNWKKLAFYACFK
jgi:hypothetical protein